METPGGTPGQPPPPTPTEVQPPEGLGSEQQELETQGADGTVPPDCVEGLVSCVIMAVGRAGSQYTLLPVRQSDGRVCAAVTVQIIS